MGPRNVSTPCGISLSLLSLRQGKESMLARKLIKVLIAEERDHVVSLLQECAELNIRDVKIECMSVATQEELELQVKTWSPTVIIVSAFHTSIDCMSALHNQRHGLASLVVISEKTEPQLSTSFLESGATAYLPLDDTFEEVDNLLNLVITLSPDKSQIH
jgi:DNA-binding NarL/FixJ family response regulator